MDNPLQDESSEPDKVPPTNGSANSPAADSKKERPKDSGRESGRSGRRDRDRTRSRRRSRSPVRGSSREDRSTSKTSRRVYVANIPFDVKWTELKDLFREKVGNVRFCQLFENEEGRPRGCGLVEFDDPPSAKRAIDILNRHEIRGRELVVKEDLDIDRDAHGRLILPSSRRERERERPRERFDDHYRSNSSDSVSSGPYNTYGLSPQFLSSLGVKGPLNNRVFVANLDYKVSESKMLEIFRLAGKVINCKLYYDNDNKSKGYGVVEFDHPVEAVQAISMFNNQKLYDRILSVRLDKFDVEDPFGASDGSNAKLPTGLDGIGKGLGIGGQPLNITKSMLNSQGPINPIGGVQTAGVTPGVIAPTGVVAPQTASAAITALTNLAGNLQNFPNLAQSLAQLSNATALPNPSLAPSGYSSANEIPPSSAPGAAFSGYQPVPPVNPASQPAYVTNQMAPTGSYGPPPSNVNPPPAYTGSAPAVNASVSSYSTYDQRDYREDKYRNQRISDTIYITNIPPSYNWQSLRDRFSEVGEVRYCETKPNGTALVRFGSQREAQRACDLMNGIRIENRPIVVDLYY